MSGTSYLHGKRPDGTADTPPPAPQKRPIQIKRGSCVINIFDVPYLLNWPLANVRKVWALMFEEDFRNEAAIATIRQWLPEAVEASREHALHLAEELPAARRYVDEKHRAVTAMGSVLMERITITKRELTYAKKKGVKGERLAPFQAAHDRAMRPKNEHQQAVKEVAFLESAYKGASADHEKAKKLQTLFNDMAAKAGL